MSTPSSSLDRQVVSTWALQHHPEEEKETEDKQGGSEAQQRQGLVGTVVALKAEVMELKAELEKAKALMKEAQTKEKKATQALKKLKSQSEERQKASQQAREVAKKCVAAIGLTLTSDLNKTPLPDVLTEVLTALERRAKAGHEAAKENLDMEPPKAQEQMDGVQPDVVEGQPGATTMGQEVVGQHVDKSRIKKEDSRKTATKTGDGAEALRAYVLELDQQAQSLSKPAHTTPLYVTFNSDPQHQYEPNVQHIARLLNDPPAQIKRVIRSASELCRGEGVLLYVTYCATQHINVDMERLKSFINLPNIEVVLVILKRGSNSQPLSVSATSLGLSLAAIVHYAISGSGLEEPHTLAGRMNTESTEVLRGLLRGDAPLAKAS